MMDSNGNYPSFCYYRRKNSPVGTKKHTVQSHVGITSKLEEVEHL